MLLIQSGDVIAVMLLQYGDCVCLGGRKNRKLLLFPSSDSTPTVAVGNHITVTGTVAEYRVSTDLSETRMPSLR